jgi:hypothetical protein
VKEFKHVVAVVLLAGLGLTMPGAAAFPAGGAPAPKAVARAVADGYTRLFGTMGTQVINPALYPKLRGDPINDCAPISLTHITPCGPVARATLHTALKQQLIGLGLEPTFGHSEDFALLIRTELPKWAA